MKTVKTVPKEEKQVLIIKQSDQSLFSRIDVLLKQFNSIFESIVRLTLMGIFIKTLVNHSFPLDHITSIVVSLLGAI